MTDVRQQLTEALDQAEQIALAASQPYRYAADDATVPPGGVHWTWVVGDNWEPVTPNPVVDETVGGAEHYGCPVNLASVEQWPTDASDHGWPVRTMPRTVANQMVEVDACAALHIARWDPATVLRLGEHGRKVLQRHAPMDNGSCEYCWGEVTWPCPDVLDLAAFWLGTPEADR